MRLRNPKLLADYMAAGDFSQARLARCVGCSRQFIHLLLTGQRTTCTVEVARRIEEAMRLLPGTLFEASVSTQREPAVAARKSA